MPSWAACPEAAPMVTMLPTDRGDTPPRHQIAKKAQDQPT